MQEVYKDIVQEEVQVAVIQVVAIHHQVVQEEEFIFWWFVASNFNSTWNIFINKIPKEKRQELMV